MQAGTRLEKKEAVTMFVRKPEANSDEECVLQWQGQLFSGHSEAFSTTNSQLRSSWDFSVPSTERSETSLKPLPGTAFSRGTQAALPIFLPFFLRQHTHFLLIYFKLKPPAHTIWAESCKTFSEQGRIFGCLFSMGCDVQTREKLYCITGQQLPPKSWTCPIPLGPFTALP